MVCSRIAGSVRRRRRPIGWSTARRPAKVSFWWIENVLAISIRKKRSRQETVQSSLTLTGRISMARIHRRKLLQLSGVGAVAAKAGGIAAILAAARAPAYAQGTTVHWLRWNDFVPASDELLKKEIAPAAEQAPRLTHHIQSIHRKHPQ